MVFKVHLKNDPNVGIKLRQIEALVQMSALSILSLTWK